MVVHSSISEAHFSLAVTYIDLAAHVKKMVQDKKEEENNAGMGSISNLQCKKIALTHYEAAKQVKYTVRD